MLRVHVTQRSADAKSGRRKRKGRLELRNVVVLGMRAGASARRELAADPELMRNFCASAGDMYVSPPASALLGPPSDAEEVAGAGLLWVTQYLPLSSLEQTAVLSGVIIYRMSYVLMTSVLGFDVNSTLHAE